MMAKKPGKPSDDGSPTKNVDEIEHDPLPFEDAEPGDEVYAGPNPLPPDTVYPDQRGAMAADPLAVDFLEFSVSAERVCHAFKKAGSRLPPLASNEVEPEHRTGYRTERIVAGYPNLDNQRVVEEFRRRRQASKAQKQRLTK